MRRHFAGLFSSAAVLAASAAMAQQPPAAATPTPAAATPTSAATPAAVPAASSATPAAPAATGAPVAQACSSIAATLTGSQKATLQAACPHITAGFLAAQTPSAGPPLSTIRYNGDSDAFNAALARSLRYYGAGHGHAINAVTVMLTRPMSLADLTTASPPSFDGTNLGVWLSEVRQRHGSVVQQDTDEGVAVAVPLLIQYGLAPVVTKLAHLFGGNPYAVAGQLDAVTVIPTHGDNTGKVIRICFVRRHAGATAACPSPDAPTAASR